MIKQIAIVTLSIVSMLLGVNNRACAQDYKYEAGAALGMSGYLGDLNNSNPFKHPGFGAGFLGRYIINYRWALKANLYTASISGSTDDINDVLPSSAQYNFNSQLYNLGVQAEFNFFNFGIGYKYKNLHRLSSYLTAGIGVVLSSCDGNTAVAPSIPLGAGVKYKLKERLNLGVEFTMRKAFGDKLDGFTNDDLNGIKSSSTKNTDWYSLIMLSMTYEFGKKCRACHYVE